MGVINNLICEKQLPLPVPIMDDVDGDFKDIVWDEYVFYTSSFFDLGDMVSNELILSNYSITEDGQFYKECPEKGVEKQDFTGEIYFWAEILGKNDDHSINFRALFYKGELKELDLEEYKKRDNQSRKEAVAKFSVHLKRELAKENSLWYRMTFPFRRVVYFLISMTKWVMFRIFALLIRIEMWAGK